jgi:thiamine-phosphate pyrophosphorylase
MTMERLKEIVSSVSIPVVAIGGINAENILELCGSGVDGVAVVSAIFAAKDPGKATADLRKLAKEVVASHG